MQSDQIVAIAMELADQARRDSIVLRIYGSCAVNIKCAPELNILEKNRRVVKDIDAVVAQRDVGALRHLLHLNSWHELIELTALTDGRRLRFLKAASMLTLDVTIDQLQFNQMLDLSGRLEIDWPTISVTDLLLSKLQIAEPSANDLIDIAAILNRFPLERSDEAGVNLRRIDSICGSSWRWYKATMSACARVQSALGTVVLLSTEQTNSAARKVQEISEEIKKTPKSFGWKARSLAGTRIGWITPVEAIEG